MTNSVKVQVADRRARILKDLSADAHFLSELIDQSMKPYAAEIGDTHMQNALLEAINQLNRVHLWAEAWRVSDEGELSGLELRRREPVRRAR